MRPLALALTLMTIGCTRASKPAPQHPVDMALARPLPQSPKESITEHPREPRNKFEFTPKPNPFTTPVTTPEPNRFTTPEHGTKPCQVDNIDHRAEELRAYITDFMSPINKSHQYRRRHPAALSYIPVILNLIDEDAERFPRRPPLDHILIGVTIAYESSWDHEVIGKLGERGYMQVHGMAAGSYDDDDLDNPVNQLDAGIRYFRRAVEQCDGDLRGALTMYATGKGCYPYWEKVIKWRWPAYLVAVEKFRKEKNCEKKTTTKVSGGAE